MADVKMVALVGNGDIRYSDIKEKRVLDGFSLSTPIPEFHTGFWTYPVTHRTPASINREAVYGNVIPVNQEHNPMSFVI